MKSLTEHLAAILPPDQFTDTLRLYGGRTHYLQALSRLNLPDRNLRMKAERRAGVEYKVIARHFRMCERHVRKIVDAA